MERINNAGSDEVGRAVGEQEESLRRNMMRLREMRLNALKAMEMMRERETKAARLSGATRLR